MRKEQSLQYIELGKMYIHMQKNETGPYIQISTQNGLKLKHKTSHYKTSRRKHGGKAA
jgi:hypothetical protein